MSRRGMKRHLRGPRPEQAAKLRARFAQAKAEAWRMKPPPPKVKTLDFVRDAKRPEK
jgi:hypothetical protein